jgi:hypothetical protein
MTTRLGLSAMKHHTSFAPLAALGYVLHHSDFFAPVREHVQLGSKTILHEPHQKLLDVMVSVLADCASLKQINTRLRPDTALAAAWGREKFADQSTITRVLDAFTPLAVAQLRTASARIYLREGQALHHPFAQELLFLDIDLTGLPAGRHAEASTKGYFSGEKTVMDANWPASVPPNTMKAWCPSSILATRRARPVYIPPWPPWSACWACRPPSGAGPFCGSTAALAPMPTSTGPSGTAIRCWPKAIVATGRRPSLGLCGSGKSCAQGPVGLRRPLCRSAIIGVPRPRC